MTAAHDSRMILDEQHVKIIFDGTMTRPQLDHPEGLAFDRKGRSTAAGNRDRSFACLWKIAR